MILCIWILVCGLVIVYSCFLVNSVAYLLDCVVDSFVILI